MPVMECSASVALIEDSFSGSTSSSHPYVLSMSGKALPTPRRNVSRDTRNGTVAKFPDVNEWNVLSFNSHIRSSGSFLVYSPVTVTDRYGVASCQ